MNLLSLASDLFARAFEQGNRGIRLRFAGHLAQMFEGTLVPQHVDISEAVCDGVTAHLTCLATRADLPLQELIGLPIEVQIVTDTGALRRFSVIITGVRQGQSDGAVTTLQLTGRDIFAVMEQRRSNRVFLNKSAPEIARIVLDGWRKRFPAIAHAFDYLLLGLDESRYPPRAMTFQAHQSDADFLRNLFKRHGIAWFFRAAPDNHGAPSLANSPPAQQLVLFDDARQLPENRAGTLKFHRRDGTEPRDTIGLLAPAHELVSGAVSRSSWDHEASRMDLTRDVSAIDQGTRGNELASALVDARIELPHAGDSWADHQRLTRLAMQRHEFRASCLHGVGGVRAQAVCEWNRIDGHPVLDLRSPTDREYVTLSLHHEAHNNLPAELNERAQSLLASSLAHIRDWRPASNDAAQAEHDDGHRYSNRFIAVRRDVPIVPAWDPQTDQPAMPPMTAVVVGPEGEPVWCDELGRVKVRILGLDPADHEHARGAGTNGNDGDSAWVRVNFLWCGDGFGILFPLRVGMELSLGFEQGDPSRPMIIGSRYHFDHPPARFDHLGSLPANRALSGIVTRELRGQRQQQLRFNDTPGNISVQLATDHAATQFNAGALSTPMNQGETQARGEGFEIRTDKAGAIRSGEALLVSAWKRLQASSSQLSADEHQALLQDFLDLFKSLGQYAAQHQAHPVDLTAQTQLRADIQGGQAPAISVSAPAGIATTTPQTILSYAGVNIDSVAQQHYQQTAGGYHIVNAGQGASIFAHQGGIKAIAHHGPLRLQSQHDSTQIDSAQDIQLSAAGGKLVGMAQDEITFITSGGAYLKLSGGEVELGGPGALTVKTNGHHWNGPASLGTDLPRFGEGDLGRTPRLLRPTDGSPVEGMKLHIGQPEANDAAGQTDAGGRGPKVSSNRLQRLKNFFLMPRS